ncbi:MAG: ParA family protein [Deltaproteobacteria bacterium]
MRRIAFINEKGGTCKTTLAVNLAAWLAKEKGKRVLLCDMDTQGHAGKSLGLDVRAMSPTVADLLLDSNTTLSSVIRQSALPGLDVLPSNKSLAELPEKLGAAPDRASRLMQRLRGLQEYDFVVFDSPPSMGLATTNVMLAADEIVIPVALTYFALDGCAEILETVSRVRGEHRHPSLRVSLVVPTLYRKTALADEILLRLSERFPEAMCKSVLGYSVRIDEAQSHGQTIWEYDPHSKGAQMLAEIGEELLRRGSVKPQARAALG